MNIPHSPSLILDQCSEKHFSTATACIRRAALKSEGKTVTLTNGCFDILHAGHVSYLQAAKALGDVLWVLLNTDTSVQCLKGPHRPINSYQNRALVLAALSCVDGVIPLGTARATAQIRTLKPNWYAKGADYSLETLDPDERAALFDIGARAYFIELTPNCSTTRLISRLQSLQREHTN